MHGQLYYYHFVFDKDGELSSFNRVAVNQPVDPNTEPTIEINPDGSRTIGMLRTEDRVPEFIQEINRFFHENGFTTWER